MRKNLNEQSLFIVQNVIRVIIGGSGMVEITAKKKIEEV